MVWLGLCTVALALTPAEVPRPTANSWVSDAANVIDAPTEAAIDEAIDRMYKDRGMEIAVVTVPDADREPKPFATALFEQWGIGRANAHDGLLVLLVMDKRRLEMETGMGLEADLTDGWLGTMQGRAMVPKFKEGDFGGGLLAGLQEVEAHLSDAPIVEPGISTTPSANKGLPVGTIVGFGAVGASGLAGILLAIAAADRRHRRLRTCPTCNIYMPKLDEAADDAHLSPAQRLEEHLGSVDHDIHQCVQCGHIVHFLKVRWFSGYSKCKQCDARAVHTSRETLQVADYVSGGEVRVTDTCEACGDTHNRIVHTPRLQQTPHRPRNPGFGSSIGSSSWGRSGRSSGGGGGSRTFGGGGSRGGGAGSSW